MLNLFQRKPRLYADITGDEVRSLLAQQRVQLVDVRSKGEWSRGHLKGATLAPLPDLERKAAKLKRDVPVICYCATGSRSRRAASMLAEMGFSDVRNLSGGIARWGGEVVR